MKTPDRAIRLLVSTFLAALLLGASNLFAQSDKSSDATPIPGKWRGWSDMTIIYKDGIFQGAYTDTYTDPFGYIKLYKKEGKWQGTWEERSINRRGILFDVEVAEDGRTISGTYSVINKGSRGDMKENVSFTWRLVLADDPPPQEEDKPCQFVDLSGVWICKDKGYLELTQKDKEVDDDCISILTGKFVKYNCSDDIWAMSQKPVNYVRGKIINGKYKIEIYPKESKDDIGMTMFRSELSGTAEPGVTSLDPTLLFGHNIPNGAQSSTVDPHTGEKHINMRWRSKPLTLQSNKCAFKKASKDAIQKPADPPCKECKKKNLEKVLSFDEMKFTNSDEIEMKALRQGSTPRYRVGSGVTYAAQESEFYFVSDFINNATKTVPRFNIRITKVQRIGRQITSFFEVCDWKTGQKIPGYKIYHIHDLSDKDLNLPDHTVAITNEYRKAGIDLFKSKILPLLKGE